MALWRIVKTIKLKEFGSKLEDAGKGKKSTVSSKKDCRRQPQFQEEHGKTPHNILSNRAVKKKIQRADVCDKSVQAVTQLRSSEVNTTRAVWTDFSMMHDEGGWPKDVNMAEPDSINRWRKKLEKDEGYQLAVPVMAENMEELIMNNNTMDVYKEFFQQKWNYPEDKKKPPYANVICEYVDPTRTQRPVSHITWANDWGHMGVAYCPFEFDPQLRYTRNEAYFFDVDIPSEPYGMIIAPSHITDLRYHPKDPYNCIAGMFNGQVAFWDSRVGSTPQALSEIEVSHKDICSSALWINSKSGCEFFSAGMDGQVIWWDQRKLSSALEVTWLDPEKGSCNPENALPCTVLEYEHSLPTKFTAGTEQGNVMIFMRKGKTPNDKLMHVYKGHRGRIRALHRNPMFIKYILSVGQDCLRIYAEDCKESSILWTAPKATPYTYGHWIPTRPSSFVACRMDGFVDFWDLLKRPVRPILSTKVSQEILTTLWPSDTGKFIAIGTHKGKVRLLKPADYLTTFTKNDKPQLAAVFDRESRREKFLEQRNREIRLRKRDKEKSEIEKTRRASERDNQRDAAIAREKETGEKVPLPDFSGGRKYDIVFEAKHDPVLLAERQFFLDIAKEMKEKGVDAFPEKREIAEQSDDQEGSDEELMTESDLVITAEDLLQYNYDPDEPDSESPRKADDAPTEIPSEQAERDEAEGDDEKDEAEGDDEKDEAEGNDEKDEEESPTADETVEDPEEVQEE